MSRLPSRRGVLSRADLVAALAAWEGGPPDATALTIADALGLEWVPPPPKPRRRRAEKAKRDAAPTLHSPAINQAPLQETRFWRAEEAEFFSGPDTAEPPPEISVYPKWRNPPQALPRFQPLSTWAELAPRLRKVLSQYHEGRAIDLNLTVRQISRGHLLERFPREHRRRWGPTLLLIEDDSHRLMPFRDDKRLVRWAVQKLLPGHSLLRALMDEQRARPELLGQQQADWPPPPGTLVLALSDLGCLALAGDSVRQRWQDIGRELQEAGCHPIALFPGPLARCTPALAAIWQLVPWERPRAHDGCGLDERAERLLRLLSPASRVSTGLLRSVRLLLPEAQVDAGTEADVWQHEGFNSHLVVPGLVPERALALRRELARQPGDVARTLRARLIRCIKGFRCGLPLEIWFDEVLNFDPAALDSQELKEDREDAQTYFAAFCDENPDLSNLSMPGGDRAWFLRVKARAPELLWQDQKVGKRLARLALALEPEGTPPHGVGARDLPAGDQPERTVYLLQTGSRLAFSADAAQGLGSALGLMPSRNGLVEIGQLEAVDDPNAFWESGQPPTWAEAWGYDEFGAWVEFVVKLKTPLPLNGTQKLDGSNFQTITQRMRWIEPGRFLMGSPATEAERIDWEGPQHEVVIQEGFWLFDSACTQALWQAVMGDNPSRFQGDGRLPVEQVSWDDAQRFIQTLNQQLPGLDLSLPSEAQWEYACRAGTNTPFSFGDNITPAQVNYDGGYPYAGGQKGEYRKKTVPVGSLPPNPWGLYEMHGNVWEWVQDPWHGHYDGAPADGSVWETDRTLPAGQIRRERIWSDEVRSEGSGQDSPETLGKATGAARVLRGGSWNYNARFCRSAYRDSNQPDVRYYDIGFRCARVQASEGQAGKPPGRAGKAEASGASLSAAARPARRLPAAGPADRSHALRGNAAGGALRPEKQGFNRSARSQAPLGNAVGEALASREKAVIPAGMPESSHKDVNLWTGALPAAPNKGAPGQLPSMALDSGIPAGMTGYQANLIRLDSNAPVTLTIPPVPRFQILTDCERLTIGQIKKPEWAKAMGRDRFGLWADFAIEREHAEPVVQRLRWIPPGRFLMGSPEGEPGRWDGEGPQHPVTIHQGYWLFDTPCTQALWEAVMGENPSRFVSPTRPVETISWEDAQRFIERINRQKHGLDLSLPSEAQWEYACRAGTDTALYTGPMEILGERNAPALDKIAWYGGNSGLGFELENGYDTSGWSEMQYPNPKAGTQPVKTRQANPWGVYDMLGNVLEWVEDPWHGNYDGASSDGSVWQTDEAGAARVLRGGAWRSNARNCRSAYRFNFPPVFRFNFIGFRCARVQA